MKKLFLLILLSASPAWATTYWASPAGSNTAVCADIDGSTDPGSYGSFARAVACASSSGDVAMIKPGTYTTNATVTNPTSGITIQGSDSASANWPVLQPTGSSVAGINFSSSRTGVTIQFIKWDFSNVTTGTSCVRGSNGILVQWTLQDFDCLGPQIGDATDTSAAITVPDGASGVIIRRGTSRRWHSADGSPGSHGFYWRGDNGTVEEVTVSDNNGYCLQYFSTTGDAHISGNTFRKNVCKDQTNKGGIFTQFGSSGNKVEQNIFINTLIGIQVSGNNSESPNLYRNNTIYKASSGTGITRNSSACQLVNNIVHLPSGTELAGANTCGTETNNTTTDPSFVSP